ncbi:dTDP-glucose 4,6-dehydratase [Zymomonas mobilis]|uniref:dTDP-glucose 4,6-dehydratase n=1 Tax=Zymomonas mobilis TaxID=542 RepID=UPI000B38B188|nr:dTDP-glucose 4,6-dehydratase [Zymomonas mobilis]ART94073.1 dTDP-glucose 4,6-dehydratase [Zymomonas mobilis subsp. mobilis]TWD60821.1 dTDP-glucose 4,6-dehydratase [Zymomonas mobilis]
MVILLTGGCGFIGSAVIRYLIKYTEHSVINVDCMTYAASKEAVTQVSTCDRYRHENININNTLELDKIFEKYHPDAVMHLAAESHVDRSIEKPEKFIETNILGTYNLLECSRTYWEKLNKSKKIFKFHHISTDEVFGHLDINDKPFTRQSPYNPRSPYSASKASSDHLVRAWRDTYGLPTFITNTANNYGPWHFPEKLIPLITLNAIHGKELPVYGDGTNIRDWLFVEDHAEALVKAIEYGEPGDTYTIGARQPRTNLQVVEAICDILDEIQPTPEGARRQLIRYVADRPGHDFRYEIDPTYAEQKLGWKAKHNFEAGIRKTIQWYLDNRMWWQKILDQRCADQRLGETN